MYSATMNYPVKPEAIEDFVSLWQEKVLDIAIEQPGFIRMMLLRRDDAALAVGTWTDREKAEAFMRTGVFKDLMATARDMLTGEPTPMVWELATFAAR